MGLALVHFQKYWLLRQNRELTPKRQHYFLFLGNYLLVTGLDEKPPNHNTYQSEVEVLEPNGYYGTSKVLPAISNYPLEVTTSGDIVSNNIIICGGSKWPGTLTSACYILESDLRWKKVLIKVF